MREGGRGTWEIQNFEERSLMETVEYSLPHFLFSQVGSLKRLASHTKWAPVPLVAYH